MKKTNAEVLLALATMLAGVTGPAAAQIELVSVVIETTPTTETLHGGAFADDPTVSLLVGDNGTILRRTENPGRAATYEDLTAYGQSQFGGSIRTVEAANVDLGAGQVWLIGGDGALIETDFTTTNVAVGFGASYTPVMPTDNGARAGEFGGFPDDRLWFWDRATQSASGTNYDGEGAIAAMCSLGGDAFRYVTLEGDVVEFTPPFTFTYLHDQDDLSPLDITAADFDESCDVVLAAVRIGGGFSQHMVFINGGSRTEASQGWRPPYYESDLDGVSCKILKELDQLSPHYVAACVEPNQMVLQRLGSSGRPMGDPILWEVPLTLPGDPEFSFLAGRHEDSVRATYVAAFDNGLVVEGTIEIGIFADGFEGADTSAWTSSTP